MKENDNYGQINLLTLSILQVYFLDFRPKKLRGEINLLICVKAQKSMCCSQLCKTELKSGEKHTLKKFRLLSPEQKKTKNT